MLLHATAAIRGNGFVSTVSLLRGVDGRSKICFNICRCMRHLSLSEATPHSKGAFSPILPNKNSFVTYRLGFQDSDPDSLAHAMYVGHRPDII